MKDLITKINEAANVIHNKSLRGSGNYIVTSSDVAGQLKIDFRRTNRILKIENIFNGDT
jgi:hypothetical protein